MAPPAHDTALVHKVLEAATHRRAREAESLAELHLGGQRCRLVEGAAGHELQHALLELLVEGQLRAVVQGAGCDGGEVVHELLSHDLNIYTVHTNK